MFFKLLLLLLLLSVPCVVVALTHNTTMVGFDSSSPLMYPDQRADLNPPTNLSLKPGELHGGQRGERSGDR
jgi:hypothetical protein